MEKERVVVEGSIYLWYKEYRKSLNRRRESIDKACRNRNIRDDKPEKTA